MHRNALLTLCLLLALPVWGMPSSDGKCGPALDVIASHPARYEVNDGEFFVSAEVMPTEEGYLGTPVPGRRTLDLNLYLKNKKRRSQKLSGKAEFKKNIDHFEGRFDQIRGVWMPAHGKTELSDNLDAVNHLTSGPTPFSVSEAALQTWTGQQAAAAGYTEVEIMELKGEPGGYTLVEVLFKKP